MPAAGTPLTPAGIIARNVRQLRKERGWRLIDLTNALNSTGATKWTTSQTSQMESGQRRVSVEEISALSYVFDVDPVEFLDGELGEKVKLPGGVAELSAVRAQFDRAVPKPAQWIRDLQVQPVDDESRIAAHKLDVSVETLREAAFRLWGRSLPAERDARLEVPEETPARVLQAKRAHITRTLLGELHQELQGEKG